MSARILPFPSRCAIQRGKEVISCYLAAGDGAQPGHVASAWLSTTTLPIIPDLSNRADRRSSGVERQPLGFSPRPERVLGNHPDCSKRIAYPLTTQSKELTGLSVSADILLFRPMGIAPNRIRELRQAAKLSQEALGDRIGVHKMTISDLERGNIELTLSYMRRLAPALSVSVADLLNVDDNPDRLEDAERALVTHFRNANRPQREMIRRIAEPLMDYVAEPVERAA